jgi:hypothetical protein
MRFGAIYKGPSRASLLHTREVIRLLKLRGWNVDRVAQESGVTDAWVYQCLNAYWMPQHCDTCKDAQSVPKKAIRIMAVIRRILNTPTIEQYVNGEYPVATKDNTG